MELNQAQLEFSKRPGLPKTQQPAVTEVISLEECKRFIGNFELSDKRILEIRNNLIGIVDSAINTYLENTR